VSSHAASLSNRKPASAGIFRVICVLMDTCANVRPLVSEVRVSAMLLFQITVNLNVRYWRGFLRHKIRRGQLKCDGTRWETKFRLSTKRTSPFKSAVASVQSTVGSRGVRISGSNAGYTMFRGSVKSTCYPLIRQFPLHFPSRASPCAITFQLEPTVKSVPLQARGA